MRGQDSVGRGVYVRSTPNEPFARHAAPRFQNLYIKPAKLSQVFAKLEKSPFFHPNHTAPYSLDGASCEGAFRPVSCYVSSLLQWRRPSILQPLYQSIYGAPVLIQTRRTCHMHFAFRALRECRQSGLE